MSRPADDGPAPGEFSSLLGFRYVGVEDGVAVVEVDPGPQHCNGGGIVHGGFISALLDTTTGWAVHEALPEGVAAPHIQLSVQYLRAGMPGRTLVCRGRSTHAGGRIGAAEAEVFQDGRLIARATSAHAVLRRGRASGGQD